MPPRHTAPTDQPGKVWIIGAGPGDPDLLTVRALRAIEQADLILFDYLVSDEIRALFPKQAAHFYVGKKQGQHSIAQADLNALLVRKARQGLKVARVKGGDAFVFGRGSEELLALRQAGIDAEVIPGITAASGCSTYAGIPLTHRGLAQGCTLVTAQGESDQPLPWAALVALKHTLVFYMGLSRAEHISRELMSAGMAPNTPCALIENGTRQDQRLHLGTLAELPQLASQAQAPALILVGEVVSLAAQLNPPAEQFLAHCQRLSA